MNKQEFEVKVLEIDEERVKIKLKSLGAVEIFNGHIAANFFKNAEGLKLRLRRMDDKNVLTYKVRQTHEAIMHNEEEEVVFDNYEGMKQILLASGFKQYGHSEKTRVSYEYQGIHFDIDTMPGIPTFLEVEASNVDDVKRGVELIGYTMAQTNTLTERKLKEHYGIA